MSKDNNITNEKPKSQFKFISKLIEILDNPSMSSIITWNDEGNVIEIRDEKRFIEEILPKHYKHNSMSNFIRQLNMYNFKKVKNYKRRNVIAYSNIFFRKNCNSLLPEVIRKNTFQHQIKFKEESITAEDKADVCTEP